MPVKRAIPLGKPEDDADEFVSAALVTAQKEYGRSRVYTAAEHEKFEYGIPIPRYALPLRYLIASDVWPLSRVTQSCGRTRTGKSAFMFQLEKWCLEAGGVVTHYDTENKTSSSLLKSLIPAKYMTGDLSKRFAFRRTKTVNEWQQMMLADMAALEHLYALKGRKSFPIFWGIDPLMGSDTDDMADEIKKRGEAPGRTFSDAPRMIWQFLRELTSRLINVPVTVHFSHHERDKVGVQHGIDKAGGSGIEFMATLDLRFRLGQLASDEEEYGSSAKSPEFTQVIRGTTTKIEGKHVNIQCRKNSGGPDVDKRIYVPLKWTFDDAEGPNKGNQISWWDWETATADLLMRQARALSGFMDIERSQPGAGANQRYFSKALKIDEKKGLPVDEFVKRIMEDEELFAKIEGALHIQHQHAFTPDLLEVDDTSAKTKKSAPPAKGKKPAPPAKGKKPGKPKSSAPTANAEAAPEAPTADPPSPPEDASKPDDTAAPEGAEDPETPEAGSGLGQNDVGLP